MKFFCEFLHTSVRVLLSFAGWKLTTTIFFLRAEAGKNFPRIFRKCLPRKKKKKMGQFKKCAWPLFKRDNLIKVVRRGQIKFWARFRAISTIFQWSRENHFPQHIFKTGSQLHGHFLERLTVMIFFCSDRWILSTKRNRISQINYPIGFQSPRAGNNGGVGFCGWGESPHLEFQWFFFSGAVPGFYSVPFATAATMEDR